MQKSKITLKYTKRLQTKLCQWPKFRLIPNAGLYHASGRIIAFILLTSICCYSAAAQDKHGLQLAAGALYQTENFHWSIAGNSSGQDPNIYSELKWKNIAGPGYFMALQWNFWNRFSVSGTYNQSYTSRGTSNDTDYHGDNRTDPVYDQNFSSNKGGTKAWQAGLGYAILKTKILSLTPSIGYGISSQSYFLVGNEGVYGILNTSYGSNWKGPFIQVNSSINLLKKLNADIDITYNQVKYHADADWNLITGFQHPRSFSDAADGYGINAAASLSYAIAPHLKAMAGVAYFNWQTGDGTDSLYLTDGETDYTRFNGAVRYGWGFRAGLCANW